jgi:hypothetical protein
VVALLRAAAGLGGHFMFMEDDFLLCPHALRALAYVTSKAHAYLPGSARTAPHRRWALSVAAALVADIGADIDRDTVRQVCLTNCLQNVACV